MIGDVAVHVIAERVQYYGPEGKLITESLKDYTRRTLTKTYASLDDFLATWTAAGKKKVIVEELERLGVLWEALAEEVGRDLDPFDLICHIAFGQPPLTRRERTEQVRKRDVFTQYGDQARLVLEALLERDADGGIEQLESPGVLKLAAFDAMGTPMELVREFGGKAGFDRAVAGLCDALTQAHRGHAGRALGCSGRSRRCWSRLSRWRSRRQRQIHRARRYFGR